MTSTALFSERMIIPALARVVASVKSNPNCSVAMNERGVLPPLTITHTDTGEGSMNEHERDTLRCRVYVAACHLLSVEALGLFNLWVDLYLNCYSHFISMKRVL